MNLYRFECIVYVRGASANDALKELHDEVKYHFSLDNNLVSLESGPAELAEEDSE